MFRSTRSRSVKATVVLVTVLWTVALVTGHRGRRINTGLNSPEICKTFWDDESKSKAQDQESSPYEIIVNRIAPGVYEVIIQGKHGQLFTDFILAIASPYQGEFSRGRYERFRCDATHPRRETLIRSLESSRGTPRRQMVTHFYPRRASGKVILRGSVYFNQTTFWNLENGSLEFPL